MKIANMVNHPIDSRSYVSSDLLVSQALVGVEVELEGVSNEIRGEEFTYWSAVEDGSLRDGGVELKFSHPYSGTDIIDALRELESTIRNIKVEPILSERTSVHVHVDVRDLTFKQFQLFLILYMIFEKTLFKYCGENRKNNIFCLSFEDAQHVISSISQLISEGLSDDPDLFIAYLAQIPKYSACNLGALREFGSIEFRGHEGEWRYEEILRWINILLCIKKYSVEMSNIDLNELPKTISDDGLLYLFNKVFDGYIDDLYYPEITEDILDGIRIAQDAINIVEMQTRPEYEEDKTDSSLFMKYMEKNYPKSYKRYKNKTGKKRGGEKDTESLSFDIWMEAMRELNSDGEEEEED